jgi:PE family
MSYVFTTPAQMQAAAQDLAGIRSLLAGSSASAAASTAAVVAPAQDEVSRLVAAMFGGFGQEYQALSAQADEFHEQFVNSLNSGAAAYLSTEVANAQQLSALNGAVQGLLGQSDGGATAGASGSPWGAIASGLTNAQAAAAPIFGGRAPLLPPLLGGGAPILPPILGGGAPIFGGGGVNLPPIPSGVAPVVGGGGMSLAPIQGGMAPVLAGVSPILSSTGASLSPILGGAVTALGNGSAVPLLTSQIGTGVQTPAGGIAGTPAVLQSLKTALAPGLLQTGASTSLPTIAGSYQTPLADTPANLQGFNTVLVR